MIIQLVYVFPMHTVVVIGFERTMYNTLENNSVSETVCASVRPPPSLAKTVEVNLASADGTAMGKPCIIITSRYNSESPFNYYNLPLQV